MRMETRMARNTRYSQRKRAVNLAIPDGLAEEAKAYGTNMSAVLERALENEHREKRREVWRAKNEKALDAWNRWVEENGLPFEDLRPW
jgi:antitoxin CcdA